MGKPGEDGEEWGDDEGEVGRAAPAADGLRDELDFCDITGGGGGGAGVLRLLPLIDFGIASDESVLGAALPLASTAILLVMRTTPHQQHKTRSVRIQACKIMTGYNDRKPELWLMVARKQTSRKRLTGLANDIDLFKERPGQRAHHFTDLPVPYLHGYRNL